MADDMAAARHHSQVPEFNDPVEAIKFYMEKDGLTQRDLVPMIGSRSKVSEVLSGTRSLTMPMARALHRHLGIPAADLLKDPATPSGAAYEEIEWRRFPLRQMANLHWIEDTQNLRESGRELVLGLKERAGLSGNATAFFRKNDQNRANAKTNPYALTAWCWQVLAKARERKPGIGEPNSERPSDLLEQVVKLSPYADGPLRAIDFLADHGIAVEMVQHLPGTHLDGAAIRSGGGQPVIGMTLRYDRIDNFWYVLLHELAHATSHLNAQDDVFIDDLALEGTDDNEKDADSKAMQALVPQDAWDSSGIEDNPSAMAVINLAQELAIHPAIVAGRVRYKKKDYRMLSQFVGSRQVRQLFPSQYGNIVS